MWTVAAWHLVAFSCRMRTVSKPSQSLIAEFRCCTLRSSAFRNKQLTTHDEFCSEYNNGSWTNTELTCRRNCREKTQATCMRAVNRQPKFTARGTRRAFSWILWKQTSPASKLESFFMQSQHFREISILSWNDNTFMEILIFSWHPPWKPKPKIFRATSKEYRNDPWRALII